MTKENISFDYDYFENGIKTHKSLYQNYHWMPEVSLPIASQIKKMYPDKVILDYGCAKGFIVYALRLLGVEAYGFDVSKYCLDNPKQEVKGLIFGPSLDALPKVDVVVSKDTFEHIPYDEIEQVMSAIFNNCDEAFIIVPLGDNGIWRVKEYELDSTHIVKENEEWWIKKFLSVGFYVKTFSHKCDNIKEKWTKEFPYSNGFFTLGK